MSNKRYFWLKLKEDFFNQKEIKMLRKIAGGDTYTIIYLKLLLLSLKNDGKVYFDGIADNFVEEIALDIDEEYENVQVTFNYLKSKNLIHFPENADDELFMSDIASMIGSESESARRVRKHRKIKALQSNGGVIESNLSVTQSKSESKSREELEREQEREQEETETNDDDAQDVNVHRFYQQNIGVESPFITEELEYWIKDLNKDLVLLALQKAVERGASYSYAKKIMSEWVNKNVTNVDEAEIESKKFKNKQGNKRNETLPNWAEKEENEPDEKVSPEEEKETRKRIEEIRSMKK